MSLNLALTRERPHAVQADAVIVAIHEDGALPAAAAEIDTASGGVLTRLVGSGDISGKAGNVARLHGLAGVTAPRVLVVGLGPRAKFDAPAYARAAGEAAKAVKTGPARVVANYLPEAELSARDLNWRTRQAALAQYAANYRYTATVKPRDNGGGVDSLMLAAADVEAALTEARSIGAGLDFARELGNLPPNICNPGYIAQQARALASAESGVAVEVLERDEMQALGMGALLAVGQGSANPPCLVVLRWSGGGDAKPYVLVGKGITFDTGGINLKVQGGIEEMKFDMCGAAAVLGSFLAAVRLKLPLNLIAIVAAVENMPDGGSYRPSDVLTTMSGQTVEVLNTDAEGRLILCDALTYARRFEPQALVDVATLTGACVIALGKHATGLMSKHDDLAAELLAAGEHTLDRAWRLPLWDEYQQQLESAFADMANIGGKWGGAITAGCFLSRFVEGQRWAHLDIAGTAWEEGRKGMATGRPVGLLVQWLIERAHSRPS